MNWQSPFPFTYHISTEKKQLRKTCARLCFRVLNCVAVRTKFFAVEVQKLQHRYFSLATYGSQAEAQADNAAWDETLPPTICCVGFG